LDKKKGGWKRMAKMGSISILTILPANAAPALVERDVYHTWNENLENGR
jgi:hypothetical protein